ncbi:MAG: hypothetical protein DME89_04790 [Verrucomicrobia bacterium]|nr:MAG: hypothetical protein DME89_04790 [Verrucomicrobiota bacterium]PYL67610.1 MAG: hypothetical protein DMF28_08775 [Verrucomicrobiota bacterium]
MVNYVREQTVGELIRNTFAIYGRGFSVIFLTYFLPVFPVNLCVTEAQIAGAKGLYLLGTFVSVFVSLIACGAITIAISDMCLGNKPSVARSYGKIFGEMLGKLFVANLLQTLFVLIGLILLIVPGVIAAVWLLLTPSVVILEGLGGMNALKRSKALGQGFYWRNFGVFLLVMVICVVLGGILGAIFGAIFGAMLGNFGGRLVYVLAQTLSAPLSLVMVVLLYYDLRVRKEAYDAAALAEDLRR